MLGVTPIGLHPIPRRRAESSSAPRPRTPHHAARARAQAHTPSGQPHTPPAPAAAAPRKTQQPPPPHHPSQTQESSPVSTSNTAATIFVACTSKPTTVLAFAMAGSSYAIVGRRAGSSRAAERPPRTTGGPAPSTPQTGRTLNPYCLATATELPPQTDTPKPEIAARADARDMSVDLARSRSRDLFAHRESRDQARFGPDHGRRLRAPPAEPTGRGGTAGSDRSPARGRRRSRGWSSGRRRRGSRTSRAGSDR